MEIRSSDEEEIVINEQNISMFSREIKIVSTIKLLQDGSITKIAQFLKDMELLLTRLTESEVIRVINKPNFDGIDSLLDDQEYSDILVKLTNPSSAAIFDFDASALSEAQIMQILINKNMFKETRN